MNEDKNYKPKVISSTTNYIINEAKADQFDDMLYLLDNTYLDGLKDPLSMKDILYAKDKFPDNDVSFEIRMATYLEIWKALEVFRHSLTITKVVDGDKVKYKVDTKN